MLSKMFKKESAAPAAAPEKVVDSAQSAADQAAWESKLQASQGDDSALLSLAKEAPMIELRLAAVAALSGEEALKAAERDLRAHNRRVHRAAKQRYELLVAQRTARTQAGALIDSAAALINDAIIPANRLVELDRAWQAIEPALLEEDQKRAFAALREQLTTLLRARGDEHISVNRWSVEARQALERLHVACAAVASGNTEWTSLSAALAAAGVAAQNTLVSAPSAPSDAISALTEALQSALRESAHIDARLAILAELASADAPHTTPDAANQRWQALPAIADTRIAEALNGHFEAWQRGALDARTARQAETRQRSREKSQTTQRARAETIASIVQTAEAALAAGQVADAAKHLVAIDDSARSGALPAALQARIDTLRAECARLKDWQHWGGGRVREDLVAEAETLAGRSTEADGSPAKKLPIKQHTLDIEKLRERWKELDRLGGATSQALWQRFDAALKTAHVPVAAHLAQMKAARQENLQARTQLLAGLDAVELTETPNWRDMSRAIEHFQSEWRKLGPIEHTVPHKSRDALLERMNASVARLHNPLQEARATAQSSFACARVSTTILRFQAR